MARNQLLLDLEHKFGRESVPGVILYRNLDPGPSLLGSGGEEAYGCHHSSLSCCMHSFGTVLQDLLLHGHLRCSLDCPLILIVEQDLVLPTRPIHADQDHKLLGKEIQEVSRWRSTPINGLTRISRFIRIRGICKKNAVLRSKGPIGHATFHPKVPAHSQPHFLLG